MELDRAILNQLRQYIEELRNELNQKPLSQWPEAHEIYAKLLDKAYILEINQKSQNDIFLPN
jgi:hypothetical protein